MKGIISSHQSPTAYQRQSAVDAVAASQASREGAVSSTKLRAIRVSISDEAALLSEEAAMSSDEDAVLLSEAVVDINDAEPSEEARAFAGGEAVVDSAKVERLRGAIAAGNLQFDAQLVAQRLIDQAE
jgi:flagellar biosynthesis anti-sigma factor FlgM